jgi:hypothetical protein
MKSHQPPPPPHKHFRKSKLHPSDTRVSVTTALSNMRQFTTGASWCAKGWSVFSDTPTSKLQLVNCRYAWNLRSLLLLFLQFLPASPITAIHLTRENMCWTDGAPETLSYTRFLVTEVFRKDFLIIYSSTSLTIVQRCHYMTMRKSGVGAELV